MATIAMIKRDGTWVPSVVADIRPGDVFHLIHNGVAQELRKALEAPSPVIMNGQVIEWKIESELLNTDQW